MTEHRVRVGPATDPQRYVATDHTVWFDEVPTAPAVEQLVGVPEDRRFAAEVDGAESGTYAGIYGVFPLRLAVPAGPGARMVPCAGLTWVGVHPDHRRKGVLTAMMRHHLEQVHAEQGTHVSALHASEPAIYARHGYGLASLEHEVTLGRGTTLRAPHLDAAAATVTTQMVTISEPEVPARMHACHHGAAEPGSVVGDIGYYTRICTQFPEQLRDKESWRVLFARHDGVDVGWAMFRRSHKWERGRPSGELSVWAVVGAPAVRLALLRRLVDFDLIATVKVHTVGADDPLLLWAGGPRATSDLATYDSLWVRLVDLPDALQNRWWAASCDVVVEVADAAAPWNAGRWRIRAGDDGAATVERTDEDCDLSLGVEALGAAYLGGSSLVAMLRAGLVAEHRREATAELWRALRTDLMPTAAVGF